MPLTRAQKEEIVTGLTQLFADSTIAIFLNFHGLSVKDGTAMRRDFLKNILRYRVVRKTFLARAIAQYSGKKLPTLAGEIGVVFGGEALSAAREVVRVAKGTKALTVQGGWWGHTSASPSQGEWMETRQIVALAAIPSREVLLAQLVMIINAPMRNMVGTLAGIPRQFIATLEAIGKIKK